MINYSDPCGDGWNPDSRFQHEENPDDAHERDVADGTYDKIFNPKQEEETNAETR